MFTAAEIQLIRAHCPSDFDALLRELSVSVDWSGDEYRVYEKLDDDISRKLSEQMKSSSVTAGYMTLLKLGDVPCDYSDTDNELLAKIVANKNKILDAVGEQVAKVDSWQRTSGNVSPGKERVEVLRMEVAEVETFTTTDIVDKLERVKETLQRDSRQSPDEGLERIISLAGTLKTKYRVVFKLVDFLQELFKLFQSSKQENIRAARDAIDTCISETQRLNELLKVRGNVHLIENVDEISDKLRVGDSCTVRLKISKDVEWREKKIPTRPVEPKFTVRDAEEILRILERLNEIVKQI